MSVQANIAKYDSRDILPNIDYSKALALDKDMLIENVKELWSLKSKREVGHVAGLDAYEHSLLANILYTIGKPEMNEHYVFLNTTRHQVIDVDKVSIYLDYIDTPFGYLYSTNFEIGTSGSSGPVSLSNITHTGFVSDLDEVGRKYVLRVIKRLSGHDEEKYIPILEKHSASAVQMSLF